MNALRTPTAAPRWPTLLALMAGVLGVHLALLVGGLPGLPHAAQPAAPLFSPESTPQAGNATPNVALGTPPSAPARVSTVRWIVPATPPARAPVQVSPVRTTPQPRSPAPPPVQAVEPTQPRAKPAAPAATEPPVVVELTPTEPIAEAHLALAEPEAPEPAPQAMKSDDKEAITAAPDNELLAAAALRKRTPATAARAQPPAQPPASTRLDYKAGWTGRWPTAATAPAWR